MNAVLGGLFSSRVNLNLREKHGYTYGAFSQFVFRKGNGPFWISAPVRTDATAAAVNEIFTEVKRMTSAPMTADELAMAKDSIVRTLPSEFETSGGTAGSLANLFIYDLGLDYYTRLPSQVNAVTGDTALAAAKKHLVAEKMIVVAVGDRAKIEPGLKKLNLGGLETRRVDGSVAGAGK
jgi:zinc protease